MRIHVSDTTASCAGLVYSGRTSSWGTPEQVKSRRDLAHLVLKPHLAPAIINTSTVTAGFSWAAYSADWPPDEIGSPFMRIPLVVL